MPDRISRYRNRISGPLLDRIDLQIDVPAVPVDELQQKSPGESSNYVRMRVEGARDRMIARQGKPNAMLGPCEVEQHCAPDENGVVMLQRAITKLGLSARSYHRTLKVARSIADLAGSENIASAHIAEAIGYRQV
jgi:magnesium chelatase family protein